MEGITAASAAQQGLPETVVAMRNDVEYNRTHKNNNKVKQEVEDIRRNLKEMPIR